MARKSKSPAKKAHKADGVKKMRRKKDKGAPKKALSAYMFFAQAYRKILVQNDPSIRSDIAKVGKTIGAHWHQLSEKEKLVYQKMADADKIRYQKEKEIYMRSIGSLSGA